MPELNGLAATKSDGFRLGPVADFGPHNTRLIYSPSRSQSE